jgi:hypothetical protein
MKKLTKKALTLDHHVIRNLSAIELRETAGGGRVCTVVVSGCNNTLATQTSDGACSDA